MAEPEQLLAAIENTGLLEQLVREVRDLKERVRFGFGYERHVGRASAGVGYLVGSLALSVFGAG